MKRLKSTQNFTEPKSDKKLKNNIDLKIGYFIGGPQAVIMII